MISKQCSISFMVILSYSLFSCKQSEHSPGTGVTRNASDIPGNAAKSVDDEQRVRLDPDKAVASAISNPDVRKFALCEIHAAIWGSYDATIDVEGSYTIDGMARHLVVKGNDLSLEISTEHLATRSNRTGMVIVRTKEDAFARGIPFFLDDVKVEAPNSLSARVWSNPTATVTKATPRLQSRPRSSSESGYVTTAEIVMTRQPIVAAPGPVDVKLTANRLDDMVLSLVVSDERIRCLESNEIDLTSLAKK